MPQMVAPWCTAPNLCSMRRPSRVRRQQAWLRAAAAVAFGSKKWPPVFEQDVPQLPLVEVIVTRRGIRKQHEMTARCGPRSGRCDRQEPLARELSDGERAQGSCSCGISGAEISQLNIRRTGLRAARLPLRAARRNARKGARGVPRRRGDNR